MKRLTTAGAYTGSLAASQGQGVATEMKQLGAVARLGGLVHVGPVGGNLVRLIKQEKLEPLREAAITGVRGHGGLPSWSDMQ